MRFKFSSKNTAIFFRFVLFRYSGVFRWCYVVVPLVFRGVPLVFQGVLLFSTFPGCSAVLPVFRVLLFCVPVFLVLQYAAAEEGEESASRRESSKVKSSFRLF